MHFSVQFINSESTKVNNLLSYPRVCKFLNNQTTTDITDNWCPDPEGSSFFPHSCVCVDTDLKGIYNMKLIYHSFCHENYRLHSKYSWPFAAKNEVS